MARPIKFGDKIFKEIFDRIANGEPLAAICRDKHMPTDRAVRKRINSDPELARAMAEARESGEEVIAHNMRETARGRGESTNDVARDKLIIYTDFQLLSKWNPKKWGDRTTLAGDKDNPIVVNEIVRRIVDSND